MNPPHLYSKSEERRAYWLLVLPAVVIYWAVTAFPLLFSIVLSMTDYSGGPIFAFDFKFIGLHNYVSMFKDPYFWISLKNNVYIILISVLGQIPLGFIFAYVIFRKLVRFGDFFQTMIYLPAVISPIVVGILWQTFFSPYGPLTKIMQHFQPGWRSTFLLDPKRAIIPVLFVMLWMYTGTYLIIFLANLQKIEPTILEAAKIEGATEFQTLWYVILPALSGVIVTTIILAISGSLTSFNLIFAMTQGNPARRTSVLALYMYDTAFRGAPNYPKASAISIFIVILSIILIIITKAVENRYGGREE